MRSNCVSCFCRRPIADETDALIILYCSGAAMAATLCCKTISARFSCSTNVAVPAPRLNASMPRAPVPAKRSSTRMPSKLSKLLLRMLKIASLVRSEVGLRESPACVRSRRPLNAPLIMRNENDHHLPRNFRSSAYQLCYLSFYIFFVKLLFVWMNNTR